MDGSLYFLASTLSTHTQALLADPRCSLLVGEPGKGDPLAHPRLTMTGSAERIGTGDLRERLKRRYPARHPKAAPYVAFPDLSFWSCQDDRVHFNGRTEERRTGDRYVSNDNI